MSKDDIKLNKDTKIDNECSGYQYFEEKFSIPIPNTKEERKKLYFQFKKREREYRIGAQILEEENALLFDRMHDYEMFNISFLYKEAERYDNIKMKKGTVYNFVKNLCEIGFLTRIEISLFSKFMRKKHRGNEIIKYVIRNCPKWRFDQLEVIKQRDHIYYLEEKEEREFQILKEKNKIRLTPEEASEKVVKTNTLIQEKTFIANIENKRKNKEKIKNKWGKNQQTADQMEQKRITGIKNGKFCPSEATQKHLIKMKSQITKYTSGRHIGQEVNWLDRHYENCKVNFEEHPLE